MRNREHFSEQIRLWRLGKGLTPEEISKRFGVSAYTFSDWERGMIPSERQKELLSKELGLDKDVLFKRCERKAFGTRTYLHRISQAFGIFCNEYKPLGERCGNF